jgi:hypothetical protein
LDEAGLVTSALWSDVDQDGWLDLLVACDWGPVRLYQNREGRLVERTVEAGLASRRGWWNGIAGADVNHDGAIDYVVSNDGLNSPYQASATEPCRLYYGDFEDNGHPQILEASLTREGLLPRHGRTVLTGALPSLAAKFPTHRDFASARLTNLFDAARLNAALMLEVNTLESGVLLNDGQGHFRFQPLPRLAQIAPSFGVALTEVDGDGHADLYLVQNFSGPRRETGRLNGGVSVLLLGQGDGTFAPLWPERSGLVVPGDARSLTTVDLNRDGWVDFVVGLNQGAMMAFENRGSRTNRCLTVQLSGKQGNPTAIGSRVAVQLKNGDRQTAEVYAGGGFLSQSSRTLFFGLGKDGEIDRVEVCWPDGQSTVHPSPPGTLSLQLQQE